MRLLSVAIAMLLTACSAQKQDTVVSTPVTCDIDYSNFQATVTGYCQEKAADLPRTIPLIEKEIEIRPVEEIPEVFWFNKKLKYSLVKQETEAPLIFVIAGTGASYQSPKMLSLQKTFFQQGYHVVSISSPTFSNFVINSTTRKDMPGNLSRDAETLYSVMQKMTAQIKAEDEVAITNYSITGYSLGGAHSAFVSHLDETEKVFNFERVLLINPPVSLYNSVSILDSYLDLQNNRAASKEIFDKIFEQFADSYSEQESSSFGQESIYDLFKDAHLTEEELKLLIGASFRMSSSEMLFAIDATYNVGAFIYKDHEISKFESITHSMLRADQVTFTQYFENAIVPWSQAEDPSITREELIQNLSLHSLENYLKTNEKIHMVTNADDLILKEGEVEYLQDVFGDRAKIFPQGGHCGNIDRESFVAYLQTQFQGATH